MTKLQCSPYCQNGTILCVNFNTCMLAVRPKPSLQNSFKAVNFLTRKLLASNWKHVYFVLIYALIEKNVFFHCLTTNIFTLGVLYIRFKIFTWDLQLIVYQKSLENLSIAE